MRAIEITAEHAESLRDVRQSIETYSAFQIFQKLLKRRSAEIAGPIQSGDVAAVCKGSDRIEVGTHAEYLTDTNKVRWY